MTADRHGFFKYMAQSLAEKYGMRATFMPKPFVNLSGNRFCLSAVCRSVGRSVGRSVVVSVSLSFCLSVSLSLCACVPLGLTVCQFHGWCVCAPGNGCHVHMSLWKGDDPVFEDAGDSRGLSLSPEAYHWLGGLMEHAQGMCALTNPTV